MSLETSCAASERETEATRRNCVSYGTKRREEEENRRREEQRRNEENQRLQDFIIQQVIND